MSKNKKGKNSNYKTNKPQASKTSQSATNKWVTPALIGLTVVVAIVIAIILITSHGNNDQISLTGNNITEMEQYLEDKYGCDFQYTSDANGFVSLFVTENTEYEIAVLTTENLIEHYGVDPDVYTEKYADNGYGILFETQIEEYYKNMTSINLGNATIVSHFNTIAYPSFVTPENSYEYYLKNYPGAFLPWIAILTDQELTEEQCKTIEQEYATLNHPIYLRISHYDASEQNLPFDVILNQFAKHGLYRANINMEEPEGEFIPNE